MSKIGVLGSGDVAKTLARGFAGRGDEVRIGSRDPSKLEGFTADTGITAGTFADIAAWGELLVLAVKGTAAVGIVSELAGSLAGKVVIDVNNPIAEAPPQGGILQLFTGPNDSLLERLQAAAPAARFVKAWSCVGAHLMIHPQLPGGRPSMFLCGDDAAARAEVTAILDGFGWDVEDIGGAAGARAIEPLVMLWCAPGFLRGDWVHAFKMLRP